MICVYLSKVHMRKVWPLALTKCIPYEMKPNGGSSSLTKHALEVNMSTYPFF